MSECSCEEIEEIIRRVIAEMLGRMPQAKKKRKLSEYNIWMSECIKATEGAIQERFKKCSLEYKKRKKEQ